MKIAFFGTPSFAVPSLERLLAAGQRVVMVVTQPDRRRGRGQRQQYSPVKTTAIAHNLPVVQPDRARNPEFSEQLSACGAELGVVVAYGQILPDHILHAPVHGIINVHASLLPRYRGAAPIQRAIIAGERETGITMIRLVREMDAGPMLARVVRSIGSDETSDVVEHALAELGADLLLSTVQTIEAGRQSEEPQDHDLATLAPRLTKEDGRVDWSLPATAIHNLIRGLHPWPHAFTFLGRSRYVVHRSEVVDAPPGTGTPGAVIAASGDDLHVACGEGTTLALHALQPEGRRVLDTRAFLVGYPVPQNATFRSAPEAR